MIKCHEYCFDLQDPIHKKVMQEYAKLRLRVRLLVQDIWGGWFVDTPSYPSLLGSFSDFYLKGSFGTRYLFTTVKEKN